MHELVDPEVGFDGQNAGISFIRVLKQQGRELSYETLVNPAPFTETDVDFIENFRGY